MAITLADNHRQAANQRSPALTIVDSVTMNFTVRRFSDSGPCRATHRTDAG